MTAAPTAAPSGDPATLPTVAELGRAYRELWRKHGRADEHRLTVKTASDSFSLADADCRKLSDQAEAVEDLIFTSPIETIADAAVLAFHGNRFAESCGDTAEGGELHALRRAFASIALVLAQHAGIDLRELGGAGSDKCLIRDAFVVGRA